MSEILLPAVRIEPTQVRYSVIWLHGLGADGHDFEPIVDELSFTNKSYTRFIFPHAPMQAVTLNNGYVMPAWYDIIGIGEQFTEDEAGIRQTETRIVALIEAEMRLGIAPEHIVLAGFSQGGAIALHTALRFGKTLAGVLALSTYLPLHKQLAGEASETNRATPIMMMHGEFDPVVPIALAQRSCAHLQALDYAVQWQTYPMPHSVCPAQIDDIGRWFNTVLS